MRILYATLLFLLIISVLGCATKYPPPDGLGYRFSSKEGLLVTVMPNKATFELPQYYDKYLANNPDKLFLKPKAIKDRLSRSGSIIEPFISLMNVVIGNEKCAVLLNGAFCMPMALYYGTEDTQAIRDKLKIRIPGFIKKYSFYSTWVPEGLPKEEYGPIITTYREWECVSFLFDIDFGDGDGAALKTHIYSTRHSGLTFVVVFVGNRFEDEYYKKERQHIMETFHFVQ